MAQTDSTANKSDADKPLSEMDELKAQMGQAIGEAISLLGGKMNMSEEEETKLVPIMAKIFRIAAKMGYVKFKDTASYVYGQIRELADKETADKFTLEHLLGGYASAGGKDFIGMSEVKSLNDLLPEPKAEDSNSPEIDGIKNDAKSTYTPPENNDYQKDWKGEYKQGRITEEHPEFKPTERQQIIIDATKKALDEGITFTQPIQNRVGEILVVPKDSPLRIASAENNVEGGVFGMDVYYAEKYINAQKKLANNIQAAKDYGFTAGYKVGKIKTSNDEVLTSVVISSIDKYGDVTLSGKRTNGKSYELSTGASAVKLMAERAGNVLPKAGEKPKPRAKLPKEQVKHAENVLGESNLSDDLFAFAEDVIMPVTNSGMVSLETLHETPAEELTDSEAETYFDNLAADIIVQAEKEGIPDVDTEEETRIIEALAEIVPAETIAEARSEARKPTHTINDDGEIVPVIRNGKVWETVDGKTEYDDSFEVTPIQSENTITLGDEILSLETVFERLKSKSESTKMRDLLKGHKDEARIMAINKGVGTNANQKHAPILQALIDLGRYSKENPRGFSMDC